ncbi:hypothetical protein HYV74_00095 [Candidatus Uhrbacteria bacterium]|nr:hypothetical protein [Candidatus Uhrbacteria bacterium]
MHSSRNPITSYRIGIVLSTLLLVGNAAWWHAPWLGIPLTILLFLGTAHALRGTHALALGGIRGMSVLTMISGALLLIGWYPLPVRLGILMGIGAITAWRMRAPPLRSRVPINPSLLRFGGACIVLASVALLLLLQPTTSAPIRSPWDAVPLFAVSSIGAIMILTAMAAHTPSLVRAVPWGIACAVLLGSGIAWAAYPIGFGFDHFLHAATEHLIATTGTLHPRPYFYSGYYGIVVFLADCTALSVATMDRILVPLVVGALVVPASAAVLRTIIPLRAATLGLLALTLTPLLPLVISTPQSFANALALCTALFLLTPATAAFARATAGAALLSQPLTGIIVSGVVLGQWFRARGYRWLPIASTIAAAVAIPLAFAIAPLFLPNLDIRLAPSASAAMAAGHQIRNLFTYTTTDFTFADALTIAQRILPIAWIVMAIIGIRHLGARARPALHVVGAACGASILVYGSIVIATLLPEEQTQFPLRLLALTALLMTPLAAIGLGTMLSPISDARRQAAASTILGIAAIATLLLAYPRNDAQTRSGLWSVSTSDIAAVHAIARDAGSTPYVVLGNQMLGAAAIRELGFQPNHRATDGTEVLAFPLPAGGPIARAFWTFVDTNPTREPIVDAMTYAGVTRAYLVLHAYWRAYPTLSAHAAAIATTELPALPYLRIFRFDRNLSPPTATLAPPESARPE